MRPRPLSDFPNCELHVDVMAATKIDAEAAKDTLSVITMWTHVDVGLAQIASRLLGAEYELGSLTFSHIESLAARVNIIMQAAEHRLDEEDQKRFKKSLARVRNAAGKCRNNVAHSAVGYATQEKDHGGRRLPEKNIVLVPQRYVAQERGRHFHAAQDLARHVRSFGESAGDWEALKKWVEEAPKHKRLKEGNPLSSISHERATVYTGKQMRRLAGLAISAICEIDAMCLIANKDVFDEPEVAAEAGRNLLKERPISHHLEWIQREEKEKK